MSIAKRDRANGKALIGKMLMFIEVENIVQALYAKNETERQG